MTQPSNPYQPPGYSPPSPAAQPGPMPPAPAAAPPMGPSIAAQPSWDIPPLLTRIGWRLLDYLFLGLAIGLLQAGLSAMAHSDEGVLPLGWRVMDFVFSSGLPTVYEILFIGLLGATAGKRLGKLTVVDVNTGTVPGLGKATLRYAVLGGLGLLGGLLNEFAPLSLILLVGGFALVSLFFFVALALSPNWDPAGRRRGWHDRAAGVIVIRSRSATASGT